MHSFVQNRASYREPITRRSPIEEARVVGQNNALNGREPDLDPLAGRQRCPEQVKLEWIAVVTRLTNWRDRGFASSAIRCSIEFGRRKLIAWFGC